MIEKTTLLSVLTAFFLVFAGGATQLFAQEGRYVKINSFNQRDGRVVYYLGDRHTGNISYCVYRSSPPQDRNFTCRDNWSYHDQSPPTEPDQGRPKFNFFGQQNSVLVIRVHLDTNVVEMCNREHRNIDPVCMPAQNLK